MEQINEDFLDTKVLDRALIFRLFSLPDNENLENLNKPRQQDACTNHESSSERWLEPLQRPDSAQRVTTEQDDTAEQSDIEPTLTEHQTIASTEETLLEMFTPFSRYACTLWHNFDYFLRARTSDFDHLEMVRGKIEPGPLVVGKTFNARPGCSKSFLVIPHHPSTGL